MTLDTAQVRRLPTELAKLNQETERMATRQAVKVFTSISTARQLRWKVAELVRKRHRRRKARLQQKASRKANRR